MFGHKYATDEKSSHEGHMWQTPKLVLSYLLYPRGKKNKGGSRKYLPRSLNYSVPDEIFLPSRPLLKIESAPDKKKSYTRL